MNDPCSRLWEIEPYRDGRLGTADARSFQRHLLACEACRAQMKRDDRLRELARALPEREPGELWLRRLRARVLRDAAAGTPPPKARRGLGAGFASAVVVAGVGVGTWAVVAHRAPPSVGGPAIVVASLPPAPVAMPRVQSEEAFAGAVVPSGAARWSQERARGIEHVVLDDGVLRLHVRPQVAGERFLVTVPDGELEVRGTTFEVHVERGATTRVHVDEGVVEARLLDQAPRRLGAGDTWTVAGLVANAPSAHAPRPTPVDSAARADGAAAAYTAAMGMLREGRNDEAASAFHAFVMSQPRAAQAEDASFLEAVALARTGRGDAAALAARHAFLASFPASFHRREAAILVARAAVHRGECEKARTVLAPWTGSGADADATATLRACEGR